MQSILIVALRSVYSLALIKAQRNWLAKPTDDTSPEPVTDIDWSKLDDDELAKHIYKSDEYDGGRSIFGQDKDLINYADSNYWNFIKRSNLLSNVKKLYQG